MHHGIKEKEELQLPPPLPSPPSHPLGEEEKHTKEEEKM